jgi:hypothetical protein
MQASTRLPGESGGDSRGGPVFPVAPTTVRVCVYRTPGHHVDVGNFVRGFTLDRRRTARLLAALRGAASSARCPVQHTFAWIWADTARGVPTVELGGCFRVARLYPRRAVGRADPKVIRSLLVSG